MFEDIKTLPELQDYRKNHIHDAQSIKQLNDFHDQLMRKVIEITLKIHQQKFGSPPTPFSFFVVGSAGRGEQGVWSDQDHGIVYERESSSTQSYFMELGKQITLGLQATGYELCDGHIMASNTAWCQSLSSWKNQLSAWLEIGEWEAMRKLLIFLDAKSLEGRELFIYQLKEHVFTYINQQPDLLLKISNNTQRIKKSIGVLGQFLVEEHGSFSGCLNIKETAFFPYVNAAKILSIKENLYQTSTLERLNVLRNKAPYENIITPLHDMFNQLLYLRHTYQQKYKPISYDASHYIHIQSLGKDEREQLKQILKNGSQKMKEVDNLIKKGC